MEWSFQVVSVRDDDGFSRRRDRMIESMTNAPALERRTITLPAATVKAVTSRVGPREFSAYVSEAIADKLRLDAVRDHLAAMEAANGPTDPAQVAEIAAWLAE
jgi:hypothetical protein